ncbi:MAG: hypothetical protein HY664_03000 [Chloroflexi bacterium]|nr:hypothetical protein [Chloroflexota bacterium]
MVIIDELFIRDYLRERLEDDEIELPDGVSLDDLADDFMEYIEIDIYEWLRDNYRSFFRDFDWEPVSKKAK